MAPTKRTTTFKILNWIRCVNLATIPLPGIYCLATTEINLYPQLIHFLVENAYVMAENLEQNLIDLPIIRLCP